MTRAHVRACAIASAIKKAGIFLSGVIITVLESIGISCIMN